MRTALQDYLERLPEPFVMLDIEARIQERTPYVVFALQEVSRAISCTHRVDRLCTIVCQLLQD